MTKQATVLAKNGGTRGCGSGALVGAGEAVVGDQQCIKESGEGTFTRTIRKRPEHRNRSGRYSNGQGIEKSSKKKKTKISEVASSGCT